MYSYKEFLSLLEIQKILAVLLMSSLQDWNVK